MSSLGEAAEFLSGGTPEKGVAEYWNGDIEEILVYNVALTPKQIKQDQAYLKAKYGIPL